MGAGGIIGASAVALAACGGACVGTWAWRRGSAHLRGTARLELRTRDRVAVAALAAARPFRGIAQRILRWEAMRRAAQAGIAHGPMRGRWDAETFVGALLALSCAVGAAAFALTLSAAFALAAACLSFVGTVLFVRHRADEAAAQMRDEVPDALRSLVDSFRSGHSLVQTMRQASEELDGSLGEVFGRVANRLETGGTTEEALEELRSVEGVPELGFAAVALEVQHQSGGSIAPVLESARASVESELELARTLRVQTAQAKLSASIVTIMPFVLVAFFSLASPGFLAPFFESALGVALLAAALVMQAAGVLAVRRICRVDE